MRGKEERGRRVFIEVTSKGLEVLQTTRARRETWLTEVLERELSVPQDFGDGVGFATAAKIKNIATQVY